MNELHWLGVLDIARAVAARTLSPVEVVQDHLARIDKLDGKLKSYLAVFAYSALAGARTAAAADLFGATPGPLHGVPVTLKDLTHTKGVTTQYGSQLRKGFVPEHDAPLVTRLKQAGAIVLGKTNTPEFAAGANTVNALFGATRNPWNPTLSPAGSSGGSAVAVATGMVPNGQGADFGGLVRLALDPAADGRPVLAGRQFHRHQDIGLAQHVLVQHRRPLEQPSCLPSQP